MSDNVERRFIGEDPRTAYAMNPGLELRAEDSGKQWITGYGAVFNSVSRNLGGFVEIIDPGAFQRAMTEGYPGAVARYNHDSNMLLGTIGGRTMSLRIDRRMGLWYEVLPPHPVLTFWNSSHVATSGIPRSRSASHQVVTSGR